ncbi:MAG: sulfur oxidation c-type cytochrome SoxA [Campylobacterales bacterium]|nr:sulfur oxidation c-type cytochrome SoxA [Campylobacterales bacterium]
MKKIILASALLGVLAFGSDQFAMSDADRAMYQEMLENNPADMDVAWGGELFEANIGSEEALAKFLGVKAEELAAYLSGFPRYIEKLGMVASQEQVLQGAMAEAGKKPLALKSKEMAAMGAYVKSLSNGLPISIDINANEQMKKAYAFGEEVFTQHRGGRGLSCMSCHAPAVIGSILRTQPLPDLGSEANKAAATWPAYRMTKSSMSTLQKRFQGCMENALLAVIPMGSPEMNALEVYVTHAAKGKEIAIPGLKR